MKKKRKKKSPTQKLKEKLWELTSLYVRVKEADDNGYAPCVTCGTSKHFKEMQAGHFIPRAKGLAVYFDLRNIHVQCFRCNINLGSNGPEYYPYMVKRYGLETINELTVLSNTTVKFTKADYETMIDDISNKLVPHARRLAI